MSEDEATAAAAAAAATTIDPNKNPDEIVEEIETAEEAKNIDGIVAYLGLLSSGDKGGEEDWAEAAEAALDALYRLVKGGAYDDNNDNNNDDDDDDNLDALFHLSAVFDCLDAWEEEDAIVEVGMGCVVAIASKAKKITDGSEKKKNDDDDDDDAPFVKVEFVLDLMKDFASEATIQEQACLAIEGLALWKNCWKKDLADAEGIREELRTARDDRITNERNKAYPVRAAAALGIDLDE
mmetsp:Transcript_21361/g.50839  ORF Transcript_21361/g.50839 Transcript_21361/m.50839 type:complete len:238 (-) Transcript_21361:1203-1916(-)